MLSIEKDEEEQENNKNTTKDDIYKQKHYESKDKTHNANDKSSAVLEAEILKCKSKDIKQRKNIKKMNKGICYLEDS